MQSEHMIKSVSIEAVVAARQAALERLETMARCYDELRALMEKYGPYSSPSVYVDGKYGRTDLRSGVEHAQKRIEGSLWQYLFEQSGLEALMDHQARTKWRQALEENDFPEFTPENIAATFTDLHDGRKDMFERGVVEVYKSLNRGLKTNRAGAFSKKLIVSYFVDEGGRWPERTGTDRLDDLVRVLHVLDGTPEPAREHRSYSLCFAAIKAGDDEYETDYLRVKWFKNGNAHVWFQCPELLKELNAILARQFPFHLKSGAGVN